MSNFKHSFFRTLLYAQLLSGFSGVAIAAQISLSVKDRPMREVIKELEETTEYRFFYNDGIKGLNSPISVDVEDADINAVMDGDLDGFINAYLNCAATGTWATK